MSHSPNDKSPTEQLLDRIDNAPLPQYPCVPRAVTEQGPDAPAVPQTPRHVRSYVMFTPEKIKEWKRSTRLVPSWNVGFSGECRCRACGNLVTHEIGRWGGYAICRPCYENDGAPSTSSPGTDRPEHARPAGSQSQG